LRKTVVSAEKAALTAEADDGVAVHTGVLVLAVVGVAVAVEAGVNVGVADGAVAANVGVGVAAGVGSIGVDLAGIKVGVEVAVLVGVAVGVAVRRLRARAMRHLAAVTIFFDPELRLELPALTAISAYEVFVFKKNKDRKRMRRIGY
jgi:hypothetical protein